VAARSEPPQAEEYNGSAMSSPRVIHSDPEILGGTPVFVGTRVPLKNLVDYLEGGHSLADFLDDFPTVSRDQAIAALEEAKELLVANAHSSR
jgi:uncharacterized protein (DUF433 family)